MRRTVIGLAVLLAGCGCLSASLIPQVSLVSGSPTLPIGSNLFITSTSTDPLDVFSGNAVAFTGIYTGGSYLVYSFELDFDQAVNLLSATVGGAGFQADPNNPGFTPQLEILDSTGAVIASQNTGTCCVGSYTVQTGNAYGTKFFLVDYDGSWNIRVRNSIALDITDAPEPGSLLLCGLGCLSGVALRRLCL